MVYDLTNFIRLIWSFIGSLLNQLIMIRFTLFGFTIDFLQLLVMLIVITAITFLLWRGVKD